MPRAINVVDFWRGFALVEIFVNHIPGNVYEQFTHKALSLSDSAELFVFLAGWSLKYVEGPAHAPRPTVHVVGRLGLRAGKLYAAHMVIVMMAIAMLALTSLWLDNPLILEWFNAGAVFTDPIEAHIGLVFLTHQLGYFDILPLYVVLLCLSPLVVILHRRRPAALLPVSAAIYFAALVGQITFPTWPTQGEWFFNPLCWQFDFVLGFLLSRPGGLGGAAQRHMTAIRWVALPIIVVAAILRVRGIELDPTMAPFPRLLFVNDKSFLTPTRIVHFLLLAALFAPTFTFFERHVPRFAGALSLLGRHSLLVFCLGSILSLAAQILRFAFRGGLPLDTIIVCAGLAISFAVARGADWWERAR
jgi:hypothetical protein